MLKIFARSSVVPLVYNWTYSAAPIFKANYNSQVSCQKNILRSRPKDFHQAVFNNVKYLNKGLQLHGLTVVGLDREGKGIVPIYIESNKGYVVFSFPRCLPDERITLVIESYANKYRELISTYNPTSVLTTRDKQKRIYHDKRAPAATRLYMSCTALNLGTNQPSQFEVQPECPLFKNNRCNGCLLQHYSYKKQIEAKTQRIRSILCSVDVNKGSKGQGFEATDLSALATNFISYENPYGFKTAALLNVELVDEDCVLTWDSDDKNNANLVECKILHPAITGIVSQLEYEITKFSKRYSGDQPFIHDSRAAGGILSKILLVHNSKDGVYFIEHTKHYLRNNETGKECFLLGFVCKGQKEALGVAARILSDFIKTSSNKLVVCNSNNVGEPTAAPIVRTTLLLYETEAARSLRCHSVLFGNPYGISSAWKSLTIAINEKNYLYFEGEIWQKVFFIITEIIDVAESCEQETTVDSLCFISAGSSPLPLILHDKFKNVVVFGSVEEFLRDCKMNFMQNNIKSKAIFVRTSFATMKTFKKFSSHALNLSHYAPKEVEKRAANKRETDLLYESLATIDLELLEREATEDTAKPLITNYDHRENIEAWTVKDESSLNGQEGTTDSLLIGTPKILVLDLSDGLFILRDYLEFLGSITSIQKLIVVSADFDKDAWLVKFLLKHDSLILSRIVPFDVNPHNPQCGIVCVFERKSVF